METGAEKCRGCGLISYALVCGVCHECLRERGERGDGSMWWAGLALCGVALLGGWVVIQCQ